MRTFIEAIHTGSAMHYLLIKLEPAGTGMADVNILSVKVNGKGD